MTQDERRRALGGKLPPLLQIVVSNAEQSEFIPGLEDEWRATLMRNQGGLCFYCRKPMELGGCGGSAATLDHVVPRCRRGAHDLSNLVAACFNCNQAKGNLSAKKFRAALATEARRAETTKIGSVHEGAGPQDNAQNQSPSRLGERPNE